MSTNKTEAKFYINDKEVNAPIGWKNTSVLCTFDNEAVQPAISMSSFTFGNEEAKTIQNIVDSGLIFEGLDFKIEVFNNLYNKIVFDGCIDLTDEYKVDEFRRTVDVKFKNVNDLIKLEEKLNSLTFGYLASIGIFQQSDYKEVEYVVQKKFNIIDNIVAALIIYNLTKELIEQTKTLSKDIADVVACIAGGATGTIAAIAYSIAILLIDSLYAVAIVSAIAKIGSVLIDNLVPIKRKAKVLNYRVAMTKISAHLGYTFESNILDLDSCYYLPSNYNVDTSTWDGFISQWKGTEKGIPNIIDAHYGCADFFNLMRKLFNGKFTILDNRLCFYNRNDAFWLKQSAFKMPSNRDKTRKYNTNELVANKRYVFEVDYTDEHTISGYKGFSYEVITSLNSTKSQNKQFVKGLNEIRFDVSLAERKDKNTGLENTLIEVAKFVDKTINSLGGNSNLAKKIKGSIGLMVIGVNNYEKPKSIKLDTNNRLVERNQWSSKYIYDTYYVGDSFTSTLNGIANYAQKIIYENVKIGFGMNDFIKVLNNSLIEDENGRIGNVMELNWNFDSDSATVTYFLRQSYCDKLTETFIEPNNIDI